MADPIDYIPMLSQMLSGIIGKSKEDTANLEKNTSALLNKVKTDTISSANTFFQTGYGMQAADEIRKATEQDAIDKANEVEYYKKKLEERNTAYTDNAGIGGGIVSKVEATTIPNLTSGYQFKYFKTKNPLPFVFDRTTSKYYAIDKKDYQGWKDGSIKAGEEVKFHDVLKQGDVESIVSQLKNYYGNTNNAKVNKYIIPTNMQELNKGLSLFGNIKDNDEKLYNYTRLLSLNSGTPQVDIYKSINSIINNDYLSNQKKNVLYKSQFSRDLYNNRNDVWNLMKGYQDKQTKDAVIYNTDYDAYNNDANSIWSKRKPIPFNPVGSAYEYFTGNSDFK